MIEITDKIKCCGCEACSNICSKNCIEMKSDDEGFAYPQVDKAVCVNCGACEKVCPILNQIDREDNPEQKAAIVQHQEREICRQSTAGGAFTAIAEYIIENKGVVFGVEMHSDYTVRHIAVEIKEELSKFRNSKYVQSIIGDTYRQAKKYLDMGKWVCFSGTPCQIEGLRHFLRKEYEKLLLIDVVCRAVPSPVVWEKYIASEIARHGEMRSIRFRDKTLGYQYSTMELIDKKDNIYRGGIESQPWLRMFFSGMIIRPSCTDCRFRSQYRNSDYTIWDCFNVHSIDKSFDENLGVTRVLIHTKKGRDIFDKIKNTFKYKEIEVDVAIKGVQQMIISPKMHVRRDAFFKDYLSMEMDVLINKYFPMSAKIKVIRKVRIILNKFGIDRTLKHILKRGR